MEDSDRVRMVRSIIRKTETAMDDVDCNQLSLLRDAFVEIIQCIGPQKSGVRKSCQKQKMVTNKPS